MKHQGESVVSEKMMNLMITKNANNDQIGFLVKKFKIELSMPAYSKSKREFFRWFMTFHEF
jgi:predicted HAD superfamily phosphohydrolase YqeG